MSLLAAARIDMLLRQAREQGAERSEAFALLGHVLGRSRAWLMAHGEELVDSPQAEALLDLVRRLAAGEPMAYLLGRQEFHGLELAVTPAVLAPRPDTETLADWAIELLEGPLRDLAQPRVLDLGTGSGAIALAIKQACPRALVVAHDESETALAVARGNADRLGLEVRFQLADWFEVREGSACAMADLVVSNPPYIAEGDPHLPALAREPEGALVAGPTGLEDIEAIANSAPHHLAPGGWLLFEHGFDQGAAVRALLSPPRWQHVATRRDLGGRERCTGACLAQP